MQKLIRVYSEHFSSAKDDLNYLNCQLQLGWKVLSNNVYEYQKGYYTDYLVEKTESK